MEEILRKVLVEDMPDHPQREAIIDAMVFKFKNMSHEPRRAIVKLIKELNDMDWYGNMSDDYEVINKWRSASEQLNHTFKELSDLIGLDEAVEIWNAFALSKFHK